MEAFFERLKQRKLVQWALAYIAAAFALIQVADIVAQRFGWPAQSVRFLIIALAIGLFVVIVLAWYHGERGAQRATGTELLILAVLLAIGGVVLWRVAPQRADDSHTANTADSSPATDTSLAVLPMVNTGGDPENEYFSDGLSEELISVLAKIPDLKIIGRTSSFHFKNSTDDSRAIGRKLGVSNLLEGSVRKQGERVRIAVDLINAATARELWSETYDRDLKDIFTVQREIAEAITAQLKIKLLATSLQSDAAPSNASVAAHNALLQADAYAQRASEQDMRKAIEHYEEATRLDRDYALAYARLSRTASLLTTGWLGGAEGDAMFARAREAAKTALRLAPDLSEAHAALGLVTFVADFDLAAGESEFRRAIALAPGDGDAKGQLAILLAGRGHLEQAIAMMREALAIDPLLTVEQVQYARFLIGLGRYDEAEQQVRKTLELQPTASRLHVLLAEIALVRGSVDVAFAEARAEPEGFWRDYALTLVAQKQGDAAAADASLQTFIQKYPDASFVQNAMIYALRKEPDKMFEWLDRAYTGKDAGIWLLGSDPFLLAYRDDPRTVALRKKLGMDN